MYFGELEIFLLRLYILGPYIDFHILGLSPITHSKGHVTYNYSFSPFEFEILPFMNRIKFSYSLFTGNESSNQWLYEKQQRQDTMRVVDSLDPQPNDLVIQSDLDEIPTPAAMRYIIQHPPETYYYLECMLFYYSFKYRYEKLWLMNSVFKYGTAKRDLNFYRNGPNDKVLPGYSCVHCSGCFSTLERHVLKMKNAAHDEFGRYPFSEKEYIWARFKCRASPFVEPKLTSKGLRPIQSTIIKFNLMSYAPFTIPSNPKLAFLFADEPFVSDVSETHPLYIKSFNECLQNQVTLYHNFINPPRFSPNNTTPFGPYWK